jgi:hypothetical protein
MLALRKVKEKMKIQTKEEDKQDNREPSEMFDFDIPHESGNLTEETIWNEDRER